MGNASHRQRLKTTLKKFCADNRLTARNLATIVEESEDTVYNWTTGRSFPSDRAMKKLCARIHLDPREWLLKDSLEALQYAEFFSFKSIAARFAKLTREESTDALIALNCAVLALYNRLVAANLVCHLHITDNTNRIDMFQQGMPGLRLTLLCSDEKLFIQLINPLVPDLMQKFEFTDAAVSTLVADFKSCNTSVL